MLGTSPPDYVVSVEIPLVLADCVCVSQLEESVTFLGVVFVEDF